jgi:3',5'-cyclic AMP phosphodiesterase CpdA
MKLIHLTDLHFVAPGQRLYGLDPRERLDAAITDINAHHADAALAVITGDLAHWGDDEAYASLRESLSALAIPIVPILGNHDDRMAFLRHFPDALQDENGFVQGHRDAPPGRLLFLDTLNEGYTAGWYCAKRRAWLARELGQHEGPFYVFMHHPPFETGMAPMDRIGLAQRGDFAAVVAPEADKVRHLFHGHVHRPISGSWMGIPFSTLRATSHQVWFDLAARGLDVRGSHEPPAYAVVLIGAETVVVHSHDYLDSSPKFSLGAPDEQFDDRAYALSLRPAAAE